MTKSHRKIYSIISSIILMFSSMPFANPSEALANPFDQVPVPNYSPVVSTNTTTTVNIPKQLAESWKGTYARPSKSLILKKDVDLPSTIFQFIFDNLKDNSKQKAKLVIYKFNPAEIYSWTGTLVSNIAVEAQEPSITIKDGRVTEFTPPQTGKSLDRYNSSLNIIQALESGKDAADLSVQITEPKTSLQSLNQLGIKELIGRGESKFNGSPANRRHNIKVGVEKMKGIIIQPGEIFSFNKYLGPVEAYAGFKPELVIKKEGTVPELGGGLCQVSSTTFRAAMHAGLPINQRRNHSYAVQYYAPQGTDATIYPGVVDLKFTNDTGNSILVWPYFKDENYLVFDFYGTYDGRKVKLGTPYSYDKKSDGSMKAIWTREVISKDGKITDDKFSSNYQPPALFHKVETFVPASPKPDNTNQVPTTNNTTPDQDQTPDTDNTQDSVEDNTNTPTDSKEPGQQAVSTLVNNLFNI